MPDRSSCGGVRQRERVLRLVRQHDGAIDATVVAAQLRVHVSTARFQLDGLCRDGLVGRTRLTRVHPLGFRSGAPRSCRETQMAAASVGVSSQLVEFRGGGDP